jgi:hypothetical protein
VLLVRWGGLVGVETVSESTLKSAEVGGDEWMLSCKQTSKQFQLQYAEVNARPAEVNARPNG